MSHAIKLLDKYVETCSLPNDSATARALHVTPQSVNNWRHGRSHPNAEAVERMCNACNEPVAKWLHLIEADRARTPADKKVWLRLAQIAASLAAAFLMLRHGLDTHAVSAFVIGAPIHYAKFLVLGTGLAWLLSQSS